VARREFTLPSSHRLVVQCVFSLFYDIVNIDTIITAMIDPVPTTTPTTTTTPTPTTPSTTTTGVSIVMCRPNVHPFVYHVYAINPVFLPVCGGSRIYRSHVVYFLYVHLVQFNIIYLPGKRRDVSEE